MVTIKPIETIYKGYRFRSRLEARWAVFFDVLGLEYQYEIEGFDLGEPGWYLPDFLVESEDRAENWFIEIKPTPLTNDERAKADALHDQPPEYASGCLVLIGTPEEPSAEWTGDGLIDFLLLLGTQLGGFLMTIMGGLPLDGNRIRAAIMAARQARFEHGEAPQAMR